MSELTTDDQVCQIAQRFIEDDGLGEIEDEDYIDICPKCSRVGYISSKNGLNENILDNWKSNENINNSLKGNYKYGCLVNVDKKVILALANKSTSTSTTAKAELIDCIGPDGNHLQATQEECDEFNKAWGNYYSQNTSSNSNNNDTQQNSNSQTTDKKAVFLTYGQYTIYCPEQNIDAVKSIDATMKSKSMEWAESYNNCADQFFDTDSCYVSCASIEKNDLNNCYSQFGYSGEESKSCTDPIWDEYSNCISQCSSAYTQCSWVYYEKDYLYSQIETLCN